MEPIPLQGLLNNFLAEKTCRSAHLMAFHQLFARVQARFAPIDSNGCVQKTSYFRKIRKNGHVTISQRRRGHLNLSLQLYVPHVIEPMGCEY
jgi:hypothetical protein